MSGAQHKKHCYAVLKAYSKQYFAIFTLVHAKEHHIAKCWCHYCVSYCFKPTRAWCMVWCSGQGCCTLGDVKQCTQCEPDMHFAFIVKFTSGR